MFIERDSQLIPLNITLTKSNSYYNFTIPYGNYKEADAVRQYKILPTVELKDGEYIINGVQSTEYKYQAVNSQYIQGEKLVVKINPETLELLINGKPIYATSNDGEVSKEPYKVSLPKITTSGDRLVKSTTSSGQTVTNDERYQLFFDSVDTGINIFQLYGASESVSKDYPDKKRYTLFKVENIEGEGDVLFRYIYYPDTKEVYKVRNDYINDETKLTLVSDFAIKDFATNDYRSFSYAVVSGSTGDSLVDITVGKPIDVNDVLGNDSLFSSRTNLLSLTLSFTTASTSSYANVYSFSQIVDNDLITKASTLSIDTATIAPTVEVTTSGRYIIDGYYTSYEYTGNELSPRKNNSNYLILGGIVTDYQISSNNIVTMKGGMVTELSINAKIFLLMLCALSIPLMKFFQGLVPWIRKQLQFIQNVISKF